MTTPSDQELKDMISQVAQKDPKTKDKTITYAPTDKAQRLRPYTNLVIQALGLEWAYVSNETKISDFLSTASDTRLVNDVTLEDLQATLGVPVAMNDYLVDVAQRMANKTDGLEGATV